MAVEKDNEGNCFLGSAQDCLRHVLIPEELFTASHHILLDNVPFDAETVEHRVGLKFVSAVLLELRSGVPCVAEVVVAVVAAQERIP